MRLRGQHPTRIRHRRLNNTTGTAPERPAAQAPVPTLKPASSRFELHHAPHTWPRTAGSAPRFHHVFATESGGHRSSRRLGETIGVEYSRIRKIC